MYEQDDIKVIWFTGRIGETAVTFNDGWIYYSTAGKNQ